MNTLTKYWFLEEFDIFKKLKKKDIRNLSNLLEMQHVDKGATIEFQTGNQTSIFFLKKGSVKIIDNTYKTTKYIVKRGNLFGELALYEQHDVSKEIAYALEDSTICKISSQHMKLLMEQNKLLNNAILKIYGLRIKKLERKLEDLLYKDSATRIQEFIFNYLNEFGSLNNNIIAVKNLLSHKEIAHLTNTSRQTVSNVLSMMRKEKLIDYNTQYIYKKINKT